MSGKHVRVRAWRRRGGGLLFPFLMSLVAWAAISLFLVLGSPEPGSGGPPQAGRAAVTPRGAPSAQPMPGESSGATTRGQAAGDRSRAPEPTSAGESGPRPSAAATAAPSTSPATTPVEEPSDDPADTSGPPEDPPGHANGHGNGNGNGHGQGGKP